MLRNLHDGFQGLGELRKLCAAVAAVVKDREPLHLRRSRKSTADILLQIPRVDFKSIRVCYSVLYTDTLEADRKGLSGLLFDSIGLGFRMMRVSCSRPMSGRDESRVSKTLGSSERFNVMVR